MANKNNTTTTTRRQSSSIWSLNKISFWTIVVVALLYVISMVLALVNVNFKIVSILQGIATAIMITIVAILAWRYVKNKPAVWILLYIICFLLVLVGIIIPLVK